MALTINVAGLAAIRTGTGNSGALQDFGYTRNGAIITFNSYWLDIKGDENGGDDGPPVDIQYMGETARIRLELYKFDPTVAAAVAARVNGATAGTPPGAGVLMFSASKAMRLLINAAGSPMNFPNAIPREPIELNKGTKFSTMVVEFEAYTVGGTLYNGTTT